MSFAKGLGTPYYAVVFSSTMNGADAEYSVTADRMQELARDMPGYLGIESARGADGFGITVSYWRDEASIAAWRSQSEHLLAQERGRREWYAHYELRVARVERAYAGPGSR